METKGLSLKEIIGIIKAGGDNNVEELWIGDINIKYRSQFAQSNVAGQIIQPNIQDSRSLLVSGEEMPLLTEEEKKAEQEEYLRAQELINDPLAHETDLIEQAIRGSA